MATRKISYGTAVTGTGGITSLGTSSTWTAGYEWYIIDNSTDLAIDRLQSGQITAGFGTANTEIRIYVISTYDGTTWPDVFDGTPSAETISLEGGRDSYAKLAALIRFETGGAAYPFFFSLAKLFGGIVPAKCAVWVTQNTGATLSATAASHTYADLPIYETIT